MPADHCSLYNGALQERRDAYRHSSKRSTRYGDQSAQPKDLANKAESAGRRAIPVDARNTSRTCPRGLVENADRVSALNVLHRAGLVLCAEA
ncbi:hypothetical protein AQJ67_11015 [Streptomyces caeruleatus]|uniref:Uncharacterized protein n=1 Tax=Streptomyces caeruleatus TaxID=661399 RepID=A0A101U5F0_9ACTN|nr:hypothetical protein AQJ67_11015 [Streptomyces caeruleatus]